MGVFKRYIKTDPQGYPIMGKNGKPMRTGPWFIQYPHDRDPNTGKIRYRTEKATHNKKIAETMLKARQDAFLVAEKFGRVVDDDLSFKQLLEWGLEQEVMKNKSTSRDDVARGKILAAAFGKVRAAQITPTMIENFRVKMLSEISPKTKKTYSGTTINKMISLARKVYFLAMDEGMVQKNPFSRRGAYKEHPKGKHMPDDEFRALVKHLPGYLKPAVITAYFTGMRRGELVKLRWDHVDMVKGEICLPPDITKTDEPRTIPFGVVPELKELFAARYTSPAAKKHGKVFTKEDGSPISAEYSSRLFRKACAKAGVGPYRFHDLRHTFVTNMRLAGNHRGVIRKITGHRTEAVFTRYDHVVGNEGASAMEKLGGFLPSV